MADHERFSTKHQRSTHIGQSRDLERSVDSLRFENRSDRDDSYNSHESFRTSRKELAPKQGYPQRNGSMDRRRYDYPPDRNSYRSTEPEERLSGSVMEYHRWISHDHPKATNGHNFERFDRGEKESSNEYRKTNTNERRRSNRGQERYDRKDELPDLRKTAHENRDNDYPRKPHDSYKHKEEERGAKSPATREMSTSYHAVFRSTHISIRLLMLPR